MQFTCILLRWDQINSLTVDARRLLVVRGSGTGLERVGPGGQVVVSAQAAAVGVVEEGEGAAVGGQVAGGGALGEYISG